MDQKRLKQLLRYEAKTGKLFWKKRKPADFTAGKYPTSRLCAIWNARFAGKEAFTADTGAGYRHGSINGKLYKAHRVIWCMLHGDWPPQIDHENGARDNNRRKNLRAATAGINAKNRKLRSDNTSGKIGVYPKGKRWGAKIGSVHIGTFDTVEAANIARQEMSAKNEYHPNHGRQN